MNKSTLELQNLLNKNSLTIEDVKKYGKLNEVYLISDSKGLPDYWLYNGVLDNEWTTSFSKYDNGDGFNHRLLVIGNGFDLALEMPTKYEDFFKDRYRINLKNKLMSSNDSSTFNKWLNNLFVELPEKDIFEYINTQFSSWDREIELQANHLNYNLNNLDDLFYEYKFNKWDCVFLLCNYYLEASSLVKWSDIENVVLGVITLIFNGVEADINLYFKNHMNSKKFRDILLNIFSIEDKDLLDKYSQQFKPQSMVNINSFNKEEWNKLESYSDSMLSELKIFEKNFAKYINKLVGDDNKEFWYERAKRLIERLLDEDAFEEKKNIIDILSFNYSFDQRFYDWLCNKENLSSRFRINSLINIHGMAYSEKSDALTNENLSHRIMRRKMLLKELPHVIFGVDSHDIMQVNDVPKVKDLRLKFSKAYRIVKNSVNNFRYFDFQKDLNTITIMGHSLSSADYSYFEEIFDQYRVYDPNSKVRLEYVYYSENDISNLLNLLINYGITLKNFHGENIVDTMIINQKLGIKKLDEISWEAPYPLNDLADDYWMKIYINWLYLQFLGYSYEYRITVRGINDLLSLIDNLKENFSKVINNIYAEENLSQYARDYKLIMESIKFDDKLNMLNEIKNSNRVTSTNINEIMKFTGSVVRTIKSTKTWKELKNIAY